MKIPASKIKYLHLKLSFEIHQFEELFHYEEFTQLSCRNSTHFVSNYRKYLRSFQS